MALTPAAIGRRYSPLIVLAAAQILLVAVAPSTPKSASTGLAAGAGSGGPIAAGDAGNAANPGDNGGAAGPAAGPGTTGGPAATGPAAGTGGSGGGGATAAGPAAPSGNAGANATAAVDRSKCDPNGKQIGPTFYMPPCVPVWHGGDNGGATMTGVAPDKINYLYYRAKGDPQVNAILAQENLAATDQQFCEAVKAFDVEINKRWEGYGRKFVSMDGPAGEHHSGAAMGSPCSTPYYQGQCSLTPPDPPCERAEADEIASMKPAYVIAPTADPAFYNELGKKGIIVSGGEIEPDSYHTNVQPYYWDVFINGDRAMQMMAEYYCKKLADKPVQWAGNGPADVMHFDGPTAPPPKRKVAITYPATNGDPTFDVTAKQFVKLVTGGQCGSAADGVKTYPYQSDITTAQQQSTTIVSQMKNDHVTTVVCFCDPIAPVFLTNTMDSQQFHPEQLMTGTGLLDYDVLGQLYNKNVWQYAFGLSTLTNSIPFAQTDAVKAWQDAGNAGQPDGTENLNWSYYSLMANSFQMAGAKPTPTAIRNALFNAAPMGGDPLHTLLAFGHPDKASPQGDYTGIKDAREVYWCNNKPSPINGQNGSYQPVDGGKRYQLTQWPGGAPAVFPNGPC